MMIEKNLGKNFFKTIFSFTVDYYDPIRILKERRSFNGQNLQGKHGQPQGF